MAKFKTRARTVDMLGRQQIAGIPTAISELFKNAHDAYADRAEVDYYRTDRLFVLRDDGLGMTEEDFESRWLTLGTESKLARRKGLKPPPTDKAKPVRPVLGEKGIGRLAIAAIGPQVLVLTRAEREGKLQDLVAAYIHWGLFELPGVDLDEIEIPVRSFANGKVPSASDLDEMLKVVEANLDRLEDRMEDDESNRFRSDLKAMRLDPSEIEMYMPDLSLATGSGTHFLIRPANEVLEDDINDSSADEPSNLEKLLLGFTNTMTPGHEPPVIETTFRDHQTVEYGKPIVDPSLFFSPEEFDNADHYISGQVDGYGQFLGTVSVYGEQHSDYTVAWTKARGVQTKCGTFSIHLAVVQGALRESTLPPEDHARLIAKTRRFGGLYIYRDGIRVLPYGNNDYDWLDIEKRRTKSAGYYYFSHRNIFGSVLLSNPKNRALTEKAGREGFRENPAYRQLRDILKNLLIQIAGDFFREEGAYGEDFIHGKEEQTRQHKALERRATLISGRKKKLVKDLEDFFRAYDADEPNLGALALANQVESDLAAAHVIDDPERAAEQFIEIESQARRKLRALEESYRVTPPRGVGLGSKLTRDYRQYEQAYAELQNNVFMSARELIEGEVTHAAENARVKLNSRLRVEQALHELAHQARQVTRTESSETQETIDRVRLEVREAAKNSFAEVDEAIKKTLSEFAATDVREMEDMAIVTLRDTLERRILDVKEHEQTFLRYIRSQLLAIDLRDELGQLDQMEALEQRNAILEERAEYDLQLAQLGMAVDVINHEFDATIRAIRMDLDRLNGWADFNEDLDSLYQGLRNSFEHLDGYLTLFTPLHRRLNRQKVEITGPDVARYLGDLFEERFRRHSVELKTTAAFREWSVIAFPSSFYPVFVNLIDNAVFWLSDASEPRIIELDAINDAVFVSNTGPAIPERRRSLIFDQGVSFKPEGRGLGLYISREVLRLIGFNLELTTARHEMSVSFRISPHHNSN